MIDLFLNMVFFFIAITCSNLGLPEVNRSYPAKHQFTKGVDMC